MPKDPRTPGFLRDLVGPALNLPVQLVLRGLVRPGHPVRTARQLAALARWGTTLAGEFVSTAARDPDRLALVDDAGALTYAEMDARTDRLAAALVAGAERPPRLGVLCGNHRGLVESLVAASKAGCDVVLLNTSMGRAAMPRVLAEHEVEILVADPEFEKMLAVVPAGPRRIWAAAPGSPGETLDELIETTSAPDPRPPARTGRIVVLSSGTTGLPKGARRPPRPGIRSLVAVLSRIPLRVHDTVLVAAPLFHTWGLAGMQFCLAVRGTLVLRRRFDPEDALAAVAGHRCDVLFAVPVMLRRVMDLPEAARARRDTSSLRVVALSGSALPGGLGGAFMDTFGDILYNLYGSTEASWVTIATPRDLRAAPGTAGRAPLGTRLAILDGDGEPVAGGRTGRIFAANGAMFEGYTGAQTPQRHAGLLGLGDVGHLDAAGRLFVDGREDDMVVSGGENVFPRELEDVLAELPEVREVAVVGVSDEEFGQRLAAYVVASPGGRLDATAVRDHARERVARFAVPRDVHFLDELPRNAAGKVVPRLLPKR